MNTRGTGTGRRSFVAMTTPPPPFSHAAANTPQATPASPAAPSNATRPELHEADLALARRVLEAQSRAVAGAAPLLGPGFPRAVDLLEQCHRAGGTVLVTGLGKSGLIGQKISATLASLGVTSHFVHPAEAAHGDLGRFRKHDVCLALSNSGETDEVINLGAVLAQDQIPIIAITAGKGGSSLERLAHAVLATGASDEEAALSPAPTLSTTTALALGDCLALCAARRIGTTNEDFARWHPGGALGGLLRPVVDIIRFRVGKNLMPAFDDLSLSEALRSGESGVRRPGALLLIDRHTQHLTGIFTDADLRRLMLKGTPVSTPISSVMTRNPATLDHQALVRDAVRMVREFRRDEIPIVDGLGRPVGLLDVQDLIALRLVQD
jgi:arabinose-5-phosphate isomerase